MSIRRASSALWTCQGCTASQRQGSYPCRECCGYTNQPAKIVRGVLTAKGKPNRRCLP